MSYFFSEQPFYGNHSTLDSHTNSAPRLPTRQDGVENRDDNIAILSLKIDELKAAQEIREANLTGAQSMPTKF